MKRRLLLAILVLEFGFAAYVTGQGSLSIGFSEIENTVSQGDTEVGKRIFIRIYYE